MAGKGAGPGGRRRRPGRPPSPVQMERVNVSLPPDVMARLRAIADREERTVPALIRLLVRRGLEALEAKGEP